MNVPLKPSELLSEQQQTDTFHPSYLDEVANAVRGPAVQAAVDMRLEQIVRHGHDAEHDSMLMIDHLPREASKRVSAAIEQITACSEKRNLPVARKNLARAAALCMAAIDRLDMVKARGE